EDAPKSRGMLPQSPRSPSRRRRARPLPSAQAYAAKRLGKLVAGLFADLCHASPKPLLKLLGRRLADLAFLLSQLLDLLAEEFAHVHVVVRLVSTCEKHLVHAMHLQALFKVLRIAQWVARERVDGVERRLAGEAVIPVVEAAPEGIPSDDEVGLDTADFSHQLSSQLDRIFNVAIRDAEECAIAYTESFGGGTLLLLANGEQLLPGHAFFLAAHVAAGREHVVDGPAFTAPACDGATAKEFGVVGMGDDDESVARAVRPGLRRSGSLSSSNSSRSANGSGQSHGTRYPVCPSLTVSRRPPTRDAITGTPQAMASTATSPKLS